MSLLHYFLYIYKHKFLKEDYIKSLIKICYIKYHAGFVVDYVYHRVFSLSDQYEQITDDYIPASLKNYKKFFRKVVYNAYTKEVSFFIVGTDESMRVAL